MIHDGKKLLKRAVTYIKRCPAKWDQDMAIGCPSCLFAHVVRLAGGVAAEFRHTASDVFETAKELMGLTSDQACYLFYYERTIADFDAFIRSDGAVPRAWTRLESL